MRHILGGANADWPGPAVFATEAVNQYRHHARMVQICQLNIDGSVIWRFTAAFDPGRHG